MNPATTTQTLRTEFSGNYAGYTPAPIDTFNIGIQKDVALVQAFSTLPESLYPDLLRFAARYSKIGAAVLVEEQNTQRYAVYQSGDRRNLEWATNALNRIEDGWTVEDVVACSPNPSSLKLGTVIDSVLSATATTETEGLQRILDTASP